jgi:hypothetical protein
MRFKDDIERDLARLADGTLTGERAREVEARVAESAELRAMLDEQRRAIGALRALDDRAPTALRARIEAARRERAPVLRARRLGAVGALAAGMAAAAIALVAILPGAGGPSLSQAAALTVKPPAAPAPTHAFDGALSLSVDGVPYPFWQESLGWKAVGMRVDKIDGRRATTVFYEKRGQRVGYTIVSGDPVSVSGNAQSIVRDGVRFRSVSIAGRTVVTWERKHHSCVLSGSGISRQVLLGLASWRDQRKLPYSAPDEA